MPAFQKLCFSAGAFILMLGGAAQAASLLPLTTEEVETLPSGTAEVILGASYFDDMRFPAFLRDSDADPISLLAAPELGFRIGAGGWAEIQASYELLRIQETLPADLSAGRTRKDTVEKYGSGDARLFTKVAVIKERVDRPGVGLRFGTKLPNADDADHLGTDEIDFMIDALLSRDFGPFSAHTNLGLHLLGNPRSSGGQDDLFAYTFAILSPRLGPTRTPEVWVRFFAELNGFEGSRFGNDRTSLRGGAQFRSAVATFYGGISAGLRDANEDFGLFGGVILTFEPADLVRRGDSDTEPAATDSGWIE